MTPPPRSSRVMGAFVLVLGGAVGLLGILRPLGAFDEALLLVGGERVLHGELPFRDFATVYPPGQHFAVSALFSLFGVDAMNLRLYCVVVRAAIALLLFLLARRLAGPVLAAGCWLASILWLTWGGFYGYPTFPALALGLLGLWLLSGALDEPADRARRFDARLAGAGVAIGAAALFRHDLGFYALAACLPSLPPLAARPGAASGPRGAGRLWPFPAGIAAAFGPPAAWLLSRVPLDEVVFSMFTYPASTYAQMRRIPYPSLFAALPSGDPLSQPQSLAQLLSNLAFYLPPAIYAAAFLWLLLRWQVRGWRAALGADEARLASVALLGAAAFNLARVRADNIHVVAGLLPAFVVAPALARRLWGGTAATRGAALALGGAALLLLAAPLRTFPRASPAQLAAILAGRPRTERAEDRFTGADRRAVAAHVREVVPPGGRIFVGCGRHDKVFVSEPLIYFLAGRLPGVKYHALDPGVATTLRVQQEIARDLDRHRVGHVILSTRFDGKSEPNGSALSSGVYHLDDYLRRNYSLERRFGEWLSVWRRTTPWEAAPAGG